MHAEVLGRAAYLTPEDQALVTHVLDHGVPARDAARHQPTIKTGHGGKARETAERVRTLLAARTIAPPRAPRTLDDMPVSVHLFLTGEQRRRLDAALERLSDRRDVALMRMVEIAERDTQLERGNDG
ncbi:MAG: hypothetical protein GC159_14545 [Phycisphaera sp.]|nr:hypothetical protein [Phycisphaera sp.]